MWNIFENCWLLLTLAGIAWVVASVIRQEKPEWGYKPLLVPLLLAALAFGLDYAFTTDYEAVSSIIPACKRAAVAGDPVRIMELISPDYKDRYHRDKAALNNRVRHIITGSSINRIRTQSHTVSIDGIKAQSELGIAVHLNNDSRYAGYGNFFLIEMAFEYEKIADKWYIRRMALTSVNNQPMGWTDVP
ncbi:MAG: hypothetical protein ABFR90_08095 [Planctomycetota bacterium]